MPPRVTRQLRHEGGQFLEVFLGEEQTTSATPILVYTSNIEIPELRVLEIIITSLVRDAGSTQVATIRKRGMYTRPTGGDLRLVGTASTEFIGDMKAKDVDVIFGVDGNRFTISARGRAATTYNWTFYLTVLRNAS